MTFTIELDVPLPPRKGRQPGRTEFPFEDLSVGASFFAGLSMAAQTAACQHAKLFPERRYATRFLEKDPIYNRPGLRVWRIR
jgi:hypothetical protein